MSIIIVESTSIPAASLSTGTEKRNTPLLSRPRQYRPLPGSLSRSLRRTTLLVFWQSSKQPAFREPAKTSSTYTEIDWIVAVSTWSDRQTCSLHCWMSSPCWCWWSLKQLCVFVLLGELKWAYLLRWPLRRVRSSEHSSNFVVYSVHRPILDWRRSNDARTSFLSAVIM